MICFALFRSVIGLQNSRRSFNQSDAALELSMSGYVTSCSRGQVLTMASWREHGVKIVLTVEF